MVFTLVSKTLTKMCFKLSPFLRLLKYSTLYCKVSNRQQDTDICSHVNSCANMRRCIHQPAPWPCCAEDRSGTQSDCDSLLEEYESINDIYEKHKTAVGEKRWAKFANKVKLDDK